jgi:cation diffusion facilitator family transporter
MKKADIASPPMQLHEHPALPGIRSTWIGIGVNLLLVAIKGIAGFLGHSHALLADATESLADVVSSLVVLAGLRYAVRPPDENHPYGHGKAEPLAATGVGLAMMGAAAFIAAQSVRGILARDHSPAPFTLPVLIIVFLIKEAMYRYVMRVGRQMGSTAVQTDAWHHRSDSLTSAAAFLGISVALIGGPPWRSADDWAALAASGLIVWNAIQAMRPALMELLDTAPEAELASRVRHVAEQVPGVRGTEKCFVRKMGLTLYVDLHVIVDGDLNVRDGHDIAHRVKDALREADPRISEVLVHIEPEA